MSDEQAQENAGSAEEAAYLDFRIDYENRMGGVLPRPRDAWSGGVSWERSRQSSEGERVKRAMSLIREDIEKNGPCECGHDDAFSEPICYRHEALLLLASASKGGE